MRVSSGSLVLSAVLDGVSAMAISASFAYSATPV
jgi:hypothetical protein